MATVDEQIRVSDRVKRILDRQRREGESYNEVRERVPDEHNLLAAEETLQRIYETITDKPEKMVKSEQASRPEQ